jgi:hypothetical protein
MLGTKSHERGIPLPYPFKWTCKGHC